MCSSPLWVEPVDIFQMVIGTLSISVEAKSVSGSIIIDNEVILITTFNLRSKYVVEAVGGSPPP